MLRKAEVVDLRNQSSYLKNLEYSINRIKNLIVLPEDLTEAIRSLPPSEWMTKDELLALLNKEFHLLTPLTNLPENKGLHLDHSFNSVNLHHQSYQINEIIKEIVALLKDACHGKLNDYLQEILNNAEIELMMDDRYPGYANSSQELNIKIRLSATIIDKYASLLKMVLGHKNTLSKKEEITVLETYRFLDLTVDRLLRIHLIYGIVQLRPEISHHFAEKKSRCCGLLNWFSSCKPQPSPGFAALSLLFSELPSQALSEVELIGALLLLLQQINLSSDKQEMTFVSDGIHHILQRQNIDFDIMSTGAYIEDFRRRAQMIHLQWPEPFQIKGTEKNLQLT